jgi:FkbM family methyltransferase
VQKLPLNSVRNFVTWPHFNPGRFLDHNAGFVRLTSGAAWAVFCRNTVPPEPGQGSIWAVRVDEKMMPAGLPIPLVGDGLDPRVVVIASRVFLFYTLIERDVRSTITGAAVALAIFEVDGEDWQASEAFVMPKRPITGDKTANGQDGWEKNWVPWVIDPKTVGLIYSHDPWDVLILDLDDGGRSRLGAVYRSPPIEWSYGTIRGGTPPVRFDAEHLVTFFHSAEVCGSRRVYSVGACVFQSRPPFAPKLMTCDPLLVAPYRTGVHRFGWRFAASVVFPMGAEPVSNGYRLLCGRDDGEIATFDVLTEELESRLAPAQPKATGTVHDYQGRGARLPLKSLLYVPDPIPGIPELPMINFLRMIAGHGRTFVDIGAHIGFYTMGLAPGYARVLSFEPSRLQYSMLTRNRALNDYGHVECEHVALGDVAGNAMLNVLSYEGGLNTLAPEIAAKRTILDQYTVPVETLDDRGLTDVDLMKIDVEGFEIPVLLGAKQTINMSRPVILMEIWEDSARRSRVQAVLHDLAYTAEYLFPFSPELAVCFPRERRHEYSWFV